jgi:hypothetical protein
MKEAIRALVEAAVRRGKAGVLAAGYDPGKQRAALAGFDHCLELETLDDFRSELLAREAAEAEMRVDLREDESVDRPAEAYWEHRVFTLQVGYVYKLLVAAAHVNRWPGSAGLPDPHASSVIAYGRLVGVKGE